MHNSTATIHQAFTPGSLFFALTDITLYNSPIPVLYATTTIHRSFTPWSLIPTLADSTLYNSPIPVHHSTATIHGAFTPWSPVCVHTSWQDLFFFLLIWKGEFVKIFMENIELLFMNPFLKRIDSCTLIVIFSSIIIIIISIIDVVVIILCWVNSCGTWLQCCCSGWPI